MCDCTSILGTIPLTEIPSYLRTRLSESGLQGDALEDAITELTQDLLEGKHIGTFTADDPHRERTSKAIHKHDRPRDLRRRQGNIAQRQLQGDLEDLKKVLYNLVGNYFDQRDNPTKYPDAPASKTKLRLEMARQLKHHYYHAYKLGLHGAGLKHAMDYKTIRLTGEEQDWVESAWQHEARYFTSFFDDLVTDSSRTNVYRRVDAYVETINAIYHAGLIRATPAESIIHWVLHPAENCPECIMVSRYSPFTKFTLPAQPKSGFSRCLCITTPQSRILTKRGAVPICDVKMGDEVLTHRLRWRPVLAVTVSDPKVCHRRAAVRAPTGAVIGCTADHCFLTPDGWLSLEYIDSYTLPMYTVPHALQELWGEGAVGQFGGDLPRVPEGVSHLREEEGPSRGGVCLMRFESQGQTAVGGPILQREDSDRSAGGGDSPEATVQGPDLGVVQRPEGGREDVLLFLGRPEADEEVHLQVSMGVGASAREHPGRDGSTPQERERIRRSPREPGVDEFSGAHLHAPQGGSQQQVEGGPADVDLPQLRDIIQAAAQRKEGKDLLLQSVHDHPTKLYDITVEEDASFIIEGLVAHNSNCKCSLRIVKARPGEVERVAAHNLAASTLLRRLTKSKNTRAPLHPHTPRRPVPQAHKTPKAT